MRVQYRRMLTFLCAVAILFVSPPMTVVAEVYLNDDEAITLETPAYIPDENLKKAILQALFKDMDYEITEADMAKLLQLEVRPSNDKIRDLTGLELAVNLMNLSIKGHNLDSLEPISELKELSVLVLENNHLTEEKIRPLAKLKQLSNLKLDSNDLRDLSSLSGLDSLKLFSCKNNLFSIKMEEDELDFTVIDRKGGVCALKHYGSSSKKHLEIDGTRIKVTAPSDNRVRLDYISEDETVEGRIILDISKVVVRADKSRLELAMKKCLEMKRADAISTDGTDVSADMTWVTEEIDRKLSEASVKAEEVFENPKATQSEVDAATEELVRALVAYQPQPGHVKVVQKTRTEVIPFQRTTVEDSEKYTDDYEVTQEGKNGKRTIVENVTYIRETEVKREEIINEITIEPIDEIITIGTKPIERIETQNRTEVIPYEKKTVEDDTKFADDREITQPGKNGTRTIVEKVFYQYDKKIGRELISNEITTAPVEEITTIGTKPIERIETQTRTEVIPYEKKTVEDDTKFADDREITQPGKNGTRTIVETVFYQYGKEIGRELISNEITTAPVEEITTIGTKPIESVKIERRMEKVRFNTIEVQDPKLEKGKIVVKQEGLEGEKTIEEKIFFTRGVETGREVISEKITQKPIDKIILIGTKTTKKEQSPTTQSEGKNKSPAERLEEVEPIITDFHKFADVQGHWAEHAIQFVINKGHFKGTSDTTFAPNLEITRGEFITVLGRMEEIETVNFSKSPIKDVVPGAYYEDYVNWAMAEGLIYGYGDGTFRPSHSITREEMATVLHRLINKSEISNSNNRAIKFVDEGKIQPWAIEAVQTLGKQGIIQGREGQQFAPQEALTRAEVAQLIYNLKTNKL